MLQFCSIFHTVFSICDQLKCKEDCFFFFSLYWGLAGEFSIKSLAGNRGGAEQGSPRGWESVSVCRTKTFSQPQPKTWGCKAGVWIPCDQRVNPSFWCRECLFSLLSYNAFMGLRPFKCVLGGCRCPVGGFFTAWSITRTAVVIQRLCGPAP